MRGHRASLSKQVRFRDLPFHLALNSLSARFSSHSPPRIRLPELRSGRTCLPFIHHHYIIALHCICIISPSRNSSSNEAKSPSKIVGCWFPAHRQDITHQRKGNLPGRGSPFFFGFFELRARLQGNHHPRLLTHVRQYVGHYECARASATDP